jgi:serine/threonine protein kinase
LIVERDDNDLSLDDPRVFKAVQEYLQALEKGNRPKRKEFLAKHADIAEPLAQCLDGLDLLHSEGTKLREPNPPTLPSAPAGAESPTALGDFLIIRELGRGGMGVVYEATQLSLGRKVALKVLPFAAALDSKQLRRFKNEAQAAAHLHHPHIVPVFGVGSERGVHYYAMQLIEGQNLATLVQSMRTEVDPESADEHRPQSQATVAFRRDHSQADDNSDDLPADPVPVSTVVAQFSTLRNSRRGGYYLSIARLIFQAAEALEYAHENGVVHRDIKPANLIVDDAGNLWITDFGLAQFQADAGLTQTGDILGTLRYMSPEQANGPRGLIDQRTDVYSLGATLYELLTLRPIFDGEDRRRLLHQIMHEEPYTPRSRDTAIPADLETIVLKAISKHPGDRYLTAGDMAQDLKRFLRDEPIHARRATLWQRGIKWLRRHPSVPIAAAILLSLMTIASIVTAFLIRNEQEKTKQAYKAEQDRAKEANDRFQLARRSVDDLIRIAEEEVADIPPMLPLRQRMLESALAYYQELIEQQSNNPDLEATKTRVSKILDDLIAIQGASYITHLLHPEVLKDLNADEDQRRKLFELSNVLQEQASSNFKDFHKLTSEQRRLRFVELARMVEKGAKSALSPKQVERLRQIDLQTRGAKVFRDPEIIATLKLTHEQQNQIRLLEVAMMMGPRDILHNGPGGRGGFGGRGSGPKRNNDSMGPEMKGPPPPKDGGPWEWDRASYEKALTLLTPEQLEIWTKIVGAKFTWTRPPFGPGKREFPPDEPPPGPPGSMN